MVLMISRGFHRRKDREAKQELDFSSDDERDLQAEVENPERPVDEQPEPDPPESDTESEPPLTTRLWRAITRR